MRNCVNRLVSASTFICVAGISGLAWAETFVWDGGSLIDNNWSSATNWSTDVAPASASNTIIKIEGHTQRNSMQDIADPFVLNRLEFINDSSTNVNYGFTVQGAKLRFEAENNNQPCVYTDRNGGNLIENDIEIPAGATLKMHFTTYGVLFRGVISGEGGIDKLANDGGIDELSNSANSFSGGLTVRANNSSWQRVNIKASGAMGTGPVNLYGGTLNTSLANPGGLVFQNTTTHTNQFFVYKDSAIFAGYPDEMSSVTLNGDMELNSFALWLRGGGFGEIGGVVSGTGVNALNKVDPGTWTLSGANTFTGRVTISKGALKLGAATALKPTVPVVIEGGSTYDLGGFSVTNGAVALNAGSIVNGTLVGTSYIVNDSGLISASLAGPSGLVKRGPGTLALQGTHAFGGALSVEGGVVKMKPQPAKGSALWLDASDLRSMAKNQDGTGGVPSHGNLVPYWRSQSKDMWVASDSPPVYHTNVVNGLPALLFDRRNLNFSTMLPAQESTAFIVYRYDNPKGNWENPINGATVYPGREFLHMINNKDNRCLTRGGGAISIDSPHSATNWSVQAVQMHAGDYRLWVNEDEYGPNTSTLEFQPFNSIGTASIKGYYCEVLIYTNEVSAVDRTNTIRYLRRKWLGEGDLPAIMDQLAPGVMAQINAGTLLDLGGGVQSFSSLQGEGKVTNAAVRVTGTLMPGDTDAAAGVLTVAGDLKLAEGATNVFDYVAATPDTVVVTGALSVEGANTLIVSLDGQQPPEQMTLFTFGSMVGEEFLSTWIIKGEELRPYSTRIKRVENTLVMTFYRNGTTIMVR